MNVVRLSASRTGRLYLRKYSWYLFSLGAESTKIDLQEVGGSCGDWMELAQDRDRWRAIVGTVMNLRVPKMRGIS